MSEAPPPWCECGSPELCARPDLDAEILELRAENVRMRGLLGDGCWHIVGCNCRAALAPKEGTPK